MMISSLKYKGKLSNLSSPCLQGEKGRVDRGLGAQWLPITIILGDSINDSYSEWGKGQEMATKEGKEHGPAT